MDWNGNAQQRHWNHAKQNQCHGHHVTRHPRAWWNSRNIWGMHFCVTIKNNCWLGWSKHAQS